MQCSACGFSSPADARFCSRCGIGLRRYCPICASPFAPGATACSFCASHVRVRQPLLSASGEAAVADTDGLNPSQRLLTERKFLTILFADIKESLNLIAGHDPEIAEELLANVIRIMSAAVHRFDGTITRVAGDGIMALFGAPQAQEDHAIRASYAALAMREMVFQESHRASQAEQEKIRVRIGLNSGEVVLRTVSNDLSTDYDAIGEAVHLAARMEQIAAPDSIYMTLNTLRLAEGCVDARLLGPVSIRGLSEPIEVAELLRAQRPRRRFRSSVSRGLTTFIDRQAELSVLSDALEMARARKGQIVAIAGEAGCGKSRLFYEFINHKRTRDFAVFEAQSVPYGGSRSFQTLIELLKECFRIDDDDDSATVRMKIVNMLTEFDGDPPRLLQPLLALLDQPTDDVEWRGLEPAQRREQIMIAIETVFRRKSAEQPLILVIEDLHSTDPETEHALDRLGDRLVDAPILLLVNYRHEYQDKWRGKSQYRQILLKPFGKPDSLEFLHALVERTPNIGALEEILADRTQGNAFFIEESLSALAEQNVLSREGSLYQLVQPIQNVSIPNTVRSVIAARIDRLASDEKNVLQVAAVIGRNVPFALLQRVSGVTEPILRAILNRLQGGDFMRAPDLFAEESYSFRHALTHEVAYSGMLVQARQRLHARIVGATELLYGHRLSEQVEQLAFHAFQGVQWEKAISYSRQSAGKAIARDANHEAVRFLEQAISACSRLENGLTRAKLGIDLRFDLRGPLFRLGELARVFDHLRAAEPLANELGDPSRLGQLNIFMSHLYWLFGDQELALKAAGQAGRIAGETSDRALAVRSDLQAALCHLMLYDYGRAVGTMRETLSYLGGTSAEGSYGLDQPLAVVVHSYLIRGLADLGEFAQARAAAKEALRLAQLVDKPFSWIFAFIGFGYLDERVGRPEDAVHWLSRAVELCEVADARLMIPPAAGFLGAAYTRAGRYAEAVSTLELATNEAASMGFRAQQPLRLAFLAEAYAGVEQWDDAFASCTRALGMADAQREVGVKAHVLRVQAQICLSQHRLGSMETAESDLQQAATIAETLGMRPLLQQCLRLLATVHRRLRDGEAAVQDLARADALLRDMGMASSSMSSVEEVHGPFAPAAGFERWPRGT